MKKRKAKTNFILLSVLTAISLVFCFISFSLPNSSSVFKGFFNAIQTNTDFSSGTRAVYEVELADYNKSTMETSVNTAMKRVQELVNEKYTEAAISKVDDNKIEIILPASVINTTYIVGFVEFSTSAYSESSFAPIMDGSHIKAATYQSNNGTPLVYIEFNDEGKKIFEETTADFEAAGGGTLYIYVDKEYSQHLSAVSIDETITGGYLPLSGGTITTKAIAESFASKIESAKLGINMTLVGEQASISNLNNILLLVSVIGFALIVLLSTLYMFKKYGQLGFISLLSMSVFMALSIIILSFLEFTQMSLSSFVAFSFVYLFALYMHAHLFNQIKGEFESGKKMPYSFKTGYIKTLFYQMDTYIALYLFAIIGLLLSFGAIKNFAIILLFTLPISALVTMLFVRLLCKMYLDINPAKHKLIKFNKPVGVEND